MEDSSSSCPAMKLMRFLETCKVPRGKKPTFTKMQGGKLYVPPKKRQVFLDLWCAAYPFLPPAFNLVPQMQKRKSPFVVDLDVFTETMVVLDTKLIQFATALLEVVDEEERPLLCIDPPYQKQSYVVLISRKDAPYRKTKMIDDNKVTGWHTGGHIYIVNHKDDSDEMPVLYSKNFMTRVRNHCYTNTSIMKEFCSGLDLLEPIAEVWDERVAKKDTFPMLIGSEKPCNDTGGPSKPFWMGRFEGVSCD